MGNLCYSNTDERGACRKYPEGAFCIRVYHDGRQAARNGGEPFRRRPANTVKGKMLMTVQNQNVKNVYRGNGSTTVFPFTFAIRADYPEYIHVYVTDDGGKAVETTDFTCDMDARTVTYPKATSSAPKLSATQRLTIYRLLPYEQNLNLVNQGPFFSENVEAELDDLEMQIQQLSENLVRCFQIGVEAQDYDMTMELEPDKVICVNSAGNGFEAREALMEVGGVWDAEGRQIKDLADPTVGGDAATKHYTDANFMKLASGNETWEARSKVIRNVQNPEKPFDAATKQYVDREIEEAPDTVKFRIYAYIDNLLADSGDGTFQYDHYLDLMPTAFPVGSSKWDIDEHGDIMPKEGVVI